MVQSYSAAKPPLRVDPQRFQRDPHKVFAELRENHPVIQIDEHGYMALRARDVSEILTGKQTIQMEGRDYARLRRIPPGYACRLLQDLFLLSNNDDHRAKRGLFAPTFSLRAVEALREDVRSTADAIVKDLPRGEPFDFIKRMASRVPSELIAAILGLSRPEAAFLADRVYRMSQVVSPVYPLECHDEIEAATAEIFHHVKDQLCQRMDRPRGDSLSCLAADWKKNRMISFPSLINQVLGIIAGGTDTTRATFAMMVSLLLRHPDQWKKLNFNRNLIPGAVAETMRFEPAAGSVARYTTEEMKVSGIRLPAGVILRTSLMSALRDPELYTDPDRFDITRTDHPRLHPALGLGPHRCIGEFLARMEMEESLAALLDGVSGIRVDIWPKLLGFGGLRQVTPMIVCIR